MKNFHGLPYPESVLASEYHSQRRKQRSLRRKIEGIELELEDLRATVGDIEARCASLLKALGKHADKELAFEAFDAAGENPFSNQSRLLRGTQHEGRAL